GAVVQRDVSAGDRHAQLETSIGQSTDCLCELPHGVRVLGRAKVESVGHGARFSACDAYRAVRGSNGLACTLVGVQFGEAVVGAGGDGHASAGVRVNANHSHHVRASHGGVALHIAVVLAGDPGSRGECR